MSEIADKKISVELTVGELLDIYMALVTVIIFHGKSDLKELAEKIASEIDRYIPRKKRCK